MMYLIFITKCLIIAACIYMQLLDLIICKSTCLNLGVDQSNTRILFVVCFGLFSFWKMKLLSRLKPVSAFTVFCSTDCYLALCIFLLTLSSFSLHLIRVPHFTYYLCPLLVTNCRRKFFWFSWKNEIKSCHSFMENKLVKCITINCIVKKSLYLITAASPESLWALSYFSELCNGWETCKRHGSVFFNTGVMDKQCTVGYSRLDISIFTSFFPHYNADCSLKFSEAF